MATESTTTWANFLKDLFVPGNIGPAMDNNFLFYKKIREAGNIIPWGGTRIEFPVQDQRQAGIGAVASGASSLPTATTSGALRPNFSARRVYGVGEIDDMAWDDSRGAGTGQSGNDFAYVSAQSKIRDDLLVTLKRAINAWWYDDGRGRLAIMPGSDDQVQFTVNQPVMVEKGFRIDVVDSGDNSTLHLTNKEVTAVVHAKDSGTSAITTGTAVSSSGAGDYVTFAGFIASGTQLGPFGIQAGMDSGNPALANYGNLDRTDAGNEAWQGNVDGNSGTNRPFSVRLASDNLELMRRRSIIEVDHEDLMGFTNWQIANEIFELQDPAVVVNVPHGEAQKINLGFKGGAGKSMTPFAFLHGAIPLHADHAAPANSMFFMHLPSWYITEVGPPELVDRDGNVLHMFENRPAYQFRYKYTHELFTKFPSANLWLQDLAHS